MSVGGQEASVHSRRSVRKARSRRRQEGTRAVDQGRPQRLLDAHKSLANIDEALGDQEGAAKEYMAASALDPTDQKLLDQARLYKQLEDLANSSGKALDDIKAGHVTAGRRSAQGHHHDQPRFRPRGKSGNRALRLDSNHRKNRRPADDRQEIFRRDRHLRAGHPRRDAAVEGAQDRTRSSPTPTR